MMRMNEPTGVDARSQASPTTAGAAGRRRVPKASDILADRLRARILGNGLQPGDPLPSEAELIRTYEYSRGTVREALRLLETDGLIDIKRGPKGGIRVREPDISQISRSLALFLTTTQTTTRSFMAFRQLIEPAAAAAAARAATAEQRRWLVGVTEQDADSTSWGGPVEFHNAIGVCSNNEILQVVIAALGQELTWQIPGERLDAHDREQTRRAHRKIAEAIEVGDPAEAEKAMRHHISQFEEVLKARGRLDEPIMPRAWWTAHT